MAHFGFRSVMCGWSIADNVERMSSGGLEATTFRLTTKIEKRIELKY